MFTKNHLISIFLLILFATLISFDTVEAIPAFARKYRTSCSTCHAAYPKLNAFGQAFRRLGYHFPAGQDAQMVKEKPVSLGAPAYKRVWPNAIWPADIPASTPIAIMLESNVTINSAADKTNVSFSDMMGTLEALAGGTIGDDINFLTSLEISSEGVDIEMGFLGFNNILPNALLNAKIGQFPPEVFFITTHRRFGPDYWITTRPVGNNEWSLEDSQKGFQASGMFNAGQSSYNLGLVEGRGNIQNSAKDVYLHLTHKFGGLPYNGVTEGNTSGRQGWGDNALQIGAFSYLGDAELTDSHNDIFRMYGGDMQLNYQGFRVNAGGAYRTDNQPFTTTDASSTTLTWFVEGNYFVYPWLIPVLRYEAFTVNPENAGSSTDLRIIPSIQALVRANLRAFVSMELEQQSGGDFEIGETALGLQLGF